MQPGIRSEIKVQNPLWVVITRWTSTLAESGCKLMHCEHTVSIAQDIIHDALRSIADKQMNFRCRVFIDVSHHVCSHRNVVISFSLCLEHGRPFQSFRTRPPLIARPCPHHQ
jgi:hypothetical protein